MASTIAGTQKLHHFKPLCSSSLLVKQFSSSVTFQIKKICNIEHLIQEDQTNGYVTVVYDEAQWLGYVIEKDTEKKTVNINFLTPKGPSPYFKYPEKQDLLDVPYCDILTKVNVTTLTGRTYTVEESEQKKATYALQRH